MVLGLSMAGAASHSEQESSTGAGPVWRRPALLTPSHPCRGCYAKESSEEWEGSVESLSISAHRRKLLP